MTDHQLKYGVRLRPLQPGEAEQLAVACAAIDPWLTLGYAAPLLARYFQRPDPALERYVIETEQSSRAGLLLARSPWLRGPFIEMLAILPQAQGQGVGRAVIQWLAGRRSDGNLWATVSAFNHSARGFYQKLGFVEVSDLPDLLQDGQDEILLRLRLG